MSNTQKLTHAAERVHITVMVDTVRFVQKPRPRDLHLSNTTNRALQHWRCSLQGWWKKVGLGWDYLVLGRAPVLVHRGELLEEALRDEGGEGDVAPVLLALLLGVLRSSFKRRSTQRFTITEKAPTRAFSWLNAPTSAFTFKTLSRHYAKWALTPR